MKKCYFSGPKNEGVFGGRENATNRSAVHVVQANQHLPEKRFDFTELEGDVFI